MERVLFVHAHPSDETVTTGATIARLVHDGAAVTVLTCTRGEFTSLLPEADKPADRAELSALHVQELSQAMSVLGVADYRMLGEPGARWKGLEPRSYGDSGSTWGASGPEPRPDMAQDSLVSADLGEVASDIAAAILQNQPDVVVTYGSDGVDGAPDRLRVHEATRWATEVLGVPLYVLGEFSGRGAVRVDDPESIETKRTALEAYRSQLAVGDDTFTRASGAPIPIAVPERFMRLRPPARGFAGYGMLSRVIACAFSFGLGAIVGGILTVVHQATVLVGSAAVPWGLIAALVVATALLAGLRVVYETRVVAGFAAAGLLLAEGLLALGTGSGSVLVADNLAGIVWTIGSVLIVAVVLAWPRITQARGSRIKVPAAKG